MELTNIKYKNIGIHVLTTIFTIDKGNFKVLLIRRKNEPYKNKWALVGGAMYNDEKLMDAATREIKEKTNIKGIDLTMVQVFDDINRSPLQRMICFSFVGTVDIEKADILKETTKTKDAKWFTIDEIPKDLAYDHNTIINKTIEEIKKLVMSSNILNQLYPNGFTLPEIQKVYETVLGKELDRRNFRKKLLNSGIIVDTNKTKSFVGKKPAKLYVFKDTKSNKIIF
ncbi:MAG: NUDIX hydrolase [Bacilli bacterium]|nr:NUDIX hydrolase [Bacilli bacterium]